MSPIRLLIAGLLTCASALACCAQNAPANEAAIPDVPTLIGQVKEHQRKLDQTRENYTYREVVVTHELDKNGNVKKTESEENNVFYVNSHELDRKVKKNGI